MIRMFGISIITFGSLLFGTTTAEQTKSPEQTAHVRGPTIFSNLARLESGIRQLLQKYLDHDIDHDNPMSEHDIEQEINDLFDSWMTNVRKPTTQSGPSRKKILVEKQDDDIITTLMFWPVSQQDGYMITTDLLSGQIEQRLQTIGQIKLMVPLKLKVYDKIGP